MNRTRMAVAAAAALAVGHLAAVVLLRGRPGDIRLANDVGHWAASLFGVAGTVTAARTFARGDYLRRVWALLAAAAALLVVGQLIITYWGRVAPGQPLYHSPLIWVRLVVITVANAANVSGLFLLAFSYARAGLMVERTTAFNLSWLVISALAVALLGLQFSADLGKLGSSGQAANALTNIASTIGDAFVVILIAPLLRVAYLMRGGRLAGAWWAVGLSGFAWLMYDCRSWIAAGAPFDEKHAMDLLYVLRNPGLSLMGLGGFLQHDAVTRPEGDAAVPVESAGGA